MSRTTGTETETSSSSEMEHPKNKFEDTLRRLAMQVEQQNLVSKTMPSVKDVLDDHNKSDKLLKNATDKVCYTQELSENTMEDKSKIMPTITSIEDFLQEFHEFSLDTINESTKSKIAKLKLKNKEEKSYVQEMNDKVKGQLERCHEERMAVIKKLPERIVSLLKYDPNGLYHAVMENESANHRILREEIAAETGRLVTEDENNQRHRRFQAFLRHVSTEADVVSECRYHLRTRKRIKSAEDLLVEDHERLMAIWDKSHKESMSYARKEGNVFLQMVTVMAHEDRKAMLKRDHEERLSMIQKLPKIIRSKLENRVERLRLAIDEDIFAHIKTHGEEILVKSEKMLEAECARRRRVY